MSFATYGDFKTALAAMAWGEITTSQVGDFFTQMQAKLYRGHGDGSDGLVQIKPLRIRAMEDSATATPGSDGTFSITTVCGSGWMEFITLKPTNAYGRSLEYLDPWEFRRRPELAVAGVASFYTIDNDTVETGPYSGTTIAARWYEKFTALSADGDTDWMLLNAPHVYQDGCMMEICAYLVDEREGQFRAKFAAGINALNRNNTVAKMSGAVLRAVPRVSV